MPDVDRSLVGTREIAFERHGSKAAGEPFLLLHGIPGWRGTWRAVAARLARAHAVVVPDLLGFGASDDPDPADFHAEAQARAVLGLLDALDLGPVHLAGFDFGGPTAVVLYRLAPDRVLSLTLAATNVFTDTPVPAPLVLARVPLVGDLAFRIAFSGLGLSLLWHAAVADGAAFPQARYTEALAFPRGIDWTRRIFLASLRDLRGLYRAVEETLPTVRVPSLVLWGDRDPFFPASVGERTARAIPGARLRVLPGSGHFIPEERSEAVAGELFALAGVASSAGSPSAAYSTP